MIVIVLVALIVNKIIRRNSLDLGIILVPKMLSENGFTSDVAARRLRDAINEVQQRSGVTMPNTAVAVRQDLPDLTIPKAEISLESLATFIRVFVPDGWRHEVSGEFTVSGTRLTLQLRLNDRVVFVDSADGLEAIGVLIVSGATVLVKTRFRELVELDGNNATLHAQLGRIWTEQGKLQDAAVEFRESIRLVSKASA